MPEQETQGGRLPLPLMLLLTAMGAGLVALLLSVLGVF